MLFSGQNASKVVAGSYSTCALRTDGSVVCWGANSNGQLGTGSTSDVGTKTGQMGNKLIPVNVGTGEPPNF